MPNVLSLSQVLQWHISAASVFLPIDKKGGSETTWHRLVIFEEAANGDIP